MRIILFICLTLNAYAAELISPEHAVQKILTLQATVENINDFENDLCNGRVEEREVWKWNRRGRSRKRVKVKEKVVSWKVFKEEVKAYNSELLDVSVISEKHADYLFEYLSNLSHIPFDYPEDGCFARAHAMVRELDDLGINSAKSFIEGNLRVETDKSPKGYVKWSYHVAPTILVYKNGKVVPYIFDPSIFDKPVPVEEWHKIQTLHTNGYYRRAYVTNKYAIDPNDKSQNEDSYSFFDNLEMKYTMKNFLEVQNERQKGK